MRTGKLVFHPLRFWVQRLVQESDLSCTVRAGENLTPHRVFDAALAPVVMSGLVHPTKLLLQLFQDALGLALERTHVEGEVVVRCNEGSGGTQVVQHDTARSPLRLWNSCSFPFLF